MWQVYCDEIGESKRVGQLSGGTETFEVYDPESEDRRWIAQIQNLHHARLIAAAPKLLEALSELVAEFELKDAEASCEPGHFGLKPSYGILLARNVIAEAKQ